MHKIYQFALYCFVFTLLSILLPTYTYANHFRSGTMSWSTVSSKTALVRVNVGWTNNHGHIPTSAAIGDVVTNKLVLNFGDGQSENVAVRVISRNATTNDVQTEAVSIKPGESDYTTGILHTYATDGNYTVSWGSSDRETAENLDGLPWRNETIVNIGGAYGGNNAVIAAIPPVIQVLDNTVFTTDLIAVDVDGDGDPIRFRYGTKQEFYGTGSGEATRPTGLILDADGTITWDVTDGTLATDVGDRWLGSVMVEDLDENGNVKSKVPLDFVLLISDSSDLPPTIVGPSASSYTVNPNESVNFSMTATDPDWTSGMASPVVSAINPPTTNNTIWATNSSSSDEETTLQVTFSPTTAMAGNSYVVIFQGTDDGGNAAIKVVTLRVANLASTPSSQGSNNAGSSTQTPVCGDIQPGGTSDLFQIDAESTKATLHFTPASNPVSNYFISYGYQNGEERFGTATGQGSSTGVLSYTIQDLDPNMTYYFKVRPQNGCMPGNWSNVMEIKTNSDGNALTKQFYKDFPAQLLSALPRQKTVLASSDKKTIVKDDHSSNVHDHCSYRVNSGDSLWSIAASELGSGTKYTEIMEHNKLSSDLLQVGQKLEYDCHE